MWFNCQVGEMGVKVHVNDFNALSLRAGQFCGDQVFNSLSGLLRPGLILGDLV